MVADRWITDWEPSTKFPLYTRANAGEVLPDPGSPLGWTLVWEPGVVMGWLDAQVSVGTFEPDEFSPTRPQVVGSFGGYLYINGQAARLFGVRAPGLSPEMIDYVYFGAHPDVPPYQPEPWHESPGNTEKLGQWMASVMSTTDLPELRDDQGLASKARLDRPDLADLTDLQLLDRAREFVPAIRALFCRHLIMTAGTSIGPGVLRAIAEALGDPGMALSLITSIGDVDSALPSHAMWALSRLDPLSEEFSVGFEDFLVQYGSRGTNEWDLRSDTWETNPSMARSLIDVMRKSDSANDPSIRNATNGQQREEITETIRTALAGQPDTLAQFNAGLRSAHVFMAGRERAKTTIIRVIHEVRMAVRELGSRHDFTPSQVCMLLNDELDAFVSDPDEYRARVIAREQQYLELFQLEPPFIITDSVKPLSQWSRRTASTATMAAIGEVLVGVPGGPGVIEGRARIILDPTDPMALEPGEILVAPVTDPAWTPLFVPAAAVVVNVGAQVSHAVIVSRELGIPCVVSVQDATNRIPNGALVRVDGGAGTVTILAL